MTTHTPPPSYVGVSMTATQAVIATVTPGLARDGGGLLAQAVDPAAVIPRTERGRRPHVARALDLGGRIGAALAAALDTAGIGWDCVDRRTLAAAVHGDAGAGESTLSLHSAAMYGEVAAGGKGRAGQALDLAVLAAYAAGALDEQSWSLLSTADWPGFEGVEAAETGDSTPPATTEPEQSVDELIAAIVARPEAPREQVEAAAKLLDTDALDRVLDKAAGCGRRAALVAAIESIGEPRLGSSGAIAGALLMAAQGTTRESAIRAALGL